MESGEVAEVMRKIRRRPKKLGLRLTVKHQGEVVVDFGDQQLTILNEGGNAKLRFIGGEAIKIRRAELDAIEPHSERGGDE